MNEGVPTAGLLLSKKAEEARESLPESMRPTFDKLHVDYKEAAKFRIGRAMVHPMIIADLVSKGWSK